MKGLRWAGPGRDGRTALAVFALAFIVYNANLRYIGSFDSLSTSLLPFRILGGHGLTLADPTPMPEGIRYSIVRGRDGKWRSLYPIATSIVVIPLYAPAAALVATGLETDIEFLRYLMDKGAASVLAALSAAALALVLLRLAAPGPALWLTAAWAFGTGTWAISSQALWQESASGLFVALALLLVVRRDPSWFAPAALGLCAGLLAANRPTDVVFTLAFLAIAPRVWDRRGLVAFVPVAVVGALTVAYNLQAFGHVLGGYGTYRAPGGSALGMSSTGLYGLSGLFGLIFSNRGLLTWCPFLLVAAAGLRRGAPRLPGASLLAAAFVASLALHGRHYDWMGGYCYGPRFALHGLGAVIAMLAIPLQRVWRSLPGRLLFAASVLFSVALQAIGAFCYPGNDSGSERPPYGFATASPIRAWQAGPAQPIFLNLLLPRRAQALSLEPPQAAARYEWEAPPPPGWPSDTVRTVKVRVTNLGDTRWSSVGGRFGRGGVLWHVRWMRPSPEGLVLATHEWRWAFFDLDPGASSSRELSFPAPQFEGPAVLEIELAQMGFVDFSALGVPPLRQAVRLDPASR
ncbi:MAG: hypothetical protein ABI768_03515 [Acidobacteriota bacterium]